MIIYENAMFHPRLLFQTHGSVMPYCCRVAIPCTAIAVALKVAVNYASDDNDVLFYVGLTSGTNSVASAAFSGFTFLIGFLLVFRASQAYQRFWEGCSSVTAMQGEWFDAGSSLMAFTKYSSCDEGDVILFQNTLVRLLSMLMGSVLMELSVGHDRTGHLQFTTFRAFEIELIDAEGIDSDSLNTINNTEAKVELLFQWVQQLIVMADNKNMFSVAPPIVSRAFQELANGMVLYRQASKIARVPLPFPYVQATELLLASHWLLTPFLMCMWTESPVWTGLLTFVQITFFWALNAISTELENPFGEDANDLPAREIQQDFNERLLLLLDPGTLRTAGLSKKAALEETSGVLRPGVAGALTKDNSGGSVGTRPSLRDKKTTFGQVHTTVDHRLKTGYVSELVDPPLGTPELSSSNSKKPQAVLAKGVSFSIKSRQGSKSPSSPVCTLETEEKLVDLPPAAIASSDISPSCLHQASRRMDRPLDPAQFSLSLGHNQKIVEHLSHLECLPDIFNIVHSLNEQLKAVQSILDICSGIRDDLRSQSITHSPAVRSEVDAELLHSAKDRHGGRAGNITLDSTCGMNSCGVRSTDRSGPFAVKRKSQAAQVRVENSIV